MTEKYATAVFIFSIRYLNFSAPKVLAKEWQTTVCDPLPTLRKRPKRTDNEEVKRRWLRESIWCGSHSYSEGKNWELHLKPNCGLLRAWCVVPWCLGTQGTEWNSSHLPIVSVDRLATVTHGRRRLHLGSNSGSQVLFSQGQMWTGIVVQRYCLKGTFYSDQSFWFAQDYSSFSAVSLISLETSQSQANQVGWPPYILCKKSCKKGQDSPQ